MRRWTIWELHRGLIRVFHVHHRDRCLNSYLLCSGHGSDSLKRISWNRYFGLLAQAPQI